LADKPTKNELVAALTGKQRQFCEEYVIDWNGTRAAKRAGYSKKTAHVVASENLTKPNVRAYVEYLRENVAEAAGISALWVAQHYKSQVESGVDKVFQDWFNRKDFDELPEAVKACIKKIETRIETYTTKDGQEIQQEQVKLEFYDKQTALRGLRDMLGLDQPTRTETKHTGEVAIGGINILQP
jgi:phage terminase small subunit